MLLRTVKGLRKQKTSKESKIGSIGHYLDCISLFDKEFHDVPDENSAQCAKIIGKIKDKKFGNSIFTMPAAINFLYSIICVAKDKTKLVRRITIKSLYLYKSRSV